MNNKGFTLIEILGVITIIGIMATLASVAVYRYINKTRYDSYINMSETVYVAAQNGVISGKYTPGQTISTSTLISDGFSSELVNPLSTKQNCTGSVRIKQTTSSDTEYNKYQYIVTLNCPGYVPKKGNTVVTTITWPDAKNE